MSNYSRSTIENILSHISSGNDSSDILPSIKDTTINLSTYYDSSVELEILNDMETKRRIIPIIYLAILTLLGSPGNLLILYIYFVRFRRKTTHRALVIALALADFLVCSLVIPFEIYQMTKEYTFVDEWFCKFCSTCKNAMVISSVLILLTLSVNRYWSICKPLRQQLRYYQTLKCIAFIACFSVLFAAPDIFLTGIKFHHLENNLVGRDCSNSEYYADTIYPMLYGSTRLLLYLLCTVALLVMCFLIGRTIVQHVMFCNQFRNSYTTKATSIFDGRPKEERLVLKQHVTNKHRTCNYIKQKLTDSPTKVTKTALIVSICYVIVYLPYMIIKVLAAIYEGHIMPQNELASIMMPILSRTHLINNVVNFIIYLAVDLSFRKECCNALFSIFCCIIGFYKE